MPKLSSNGFIFIWVINNKYARAFDLMRKWGYRYNHLMNTLYQPWSPSTLWKNIELNLFFFFFSFLHTLTTDSYVDDITWVKQTVNRRMAKGHGYYLQHAKETCLVGKKVIIYTI